MSLLFGFLPIVLLITFGLWIIHDQEQLFRFEGKLKRGLRIWAEPITEEMRQFLKGVPASARYDQGFIRRENDEILAAAERSFWEHFFSRQRGLRYVGYVDLSVPDGRLEFRISLSFLISVTISLAIMVVALFYTSFLALAGESMLPVRVGFFLLIVLVTFIGLLALIHHQERKGLLVFLHQAMRQKR